MSSNLVRVSILYNSKEIILDLNPFDNDLYDNFIKALSEATGEKNIQNDFKIMTLNTNIPYLLIDEDNLWNVIHEDRKEENLKLFMNKKEKNEGDEDDDDFLSGFKNLKTFDEDFDDIERVTLPKDLNIEKEEKEKQKNDIRNNNINNEENNINKNKEEENNDNENNMNKIIDNKNNDNVNIINDKDENKIIENEESNKEEENIFSGLELLTPNPNNNKENKKEKEKEEEEEEEEIFKINNIKGLIDDSKDDKTKKKKSENNKKINKENISFKNNKTFQDEFCSLCEEQLYGIKYICALCENIILCEKCENSHQHPCFVYKSKFISTIKDTFNYITKNYSNKISKSTFFSKISKPSYELSISLIGDQDIFLRPNKGVMIPVKINNKSNKIINSSNFLIIVKGNKLIKISYHENEAFNILPRSHHIIKFKCITPPKLCTEKVSMYLFSSTIDIKSNNNLKININIEINEDQDEEKLNNKLLNNDMVIFYNKEHKKILDSLLENELKENNPINIMLKLKKNDWDKEKTIKEIQIKNKK